MPNFTTRPFVRSHGRQPRGHGRWALQPTRSVNGYAADLHGEILFVDGTLTEARTAAQDHFADEALVAVLP